jgi:hypothetical protein
MDSLGQGPHGQSAVLPEFRQDPVISLIQRDNLSSGDRFNLLGGSHLLIILRRKRHYLQS